MPGVAFDLGFNRLGHGKGYFDSFLSRYQSQHSEVPPLIAVALSPQIIAEVPTEEHDFRMDVITTGEGMHVRKAGDV